MAKKFLVPLGVNGLASDPASGSEGEIYFNTVSKSLKLYKNGAWEELTGGGGNDSASIIAYIDQNIDDTYDLIFEGQYTDDIDEGVTNLYFTEARAIAAARPTINAASAYAVTVANTYTDNELSNYEVLPSQTGNAGKYLTTNGTSTSWGELDLVAGINTASTAATASAFIYTDQQIALVENDPTNISFIRWNKVISASTSTISGLDDNSETLDYIPGIEQVFINGAFIPRDDYTATSGSSIVFDEPLNITDIVEVLCLKTVAVVTEEQLATSIDRWTKTVSASTSTMSGLDDYSKTLSYSTGYMTVYINGVLIDPSEYTATSGSTVVFDIPVNVNDVVEVLSYRSVGYLWDFYSLLNSASVAATASANSYTDAAIASFEALPSQTGNGGKFLTTDGLTTSWDAIVLDPILYPDYIAFDTAPVLTSASTGTLSWDSGESGLATQLNTNINVILGQEIYSVVYNGEGTTLNKGEVVMVSGAQGQKPRVIRAYNTSDAGSARTFGIVAENIASGAEGIVITQGIVKNINTNGFNEGDPLYLSATPGQLTTTKPQAPNHYVWVGVVVKKNSSSGRIYVKPQNGYELDEIHDVRITSIQNDDLIVYNSASSIWVNSPKQDIINTASAAAVTYLVDSAPGTLDTLNELSAALNDDPNFYSTIQSVYLTQSNASATYLTQAEGLTAAAASSTYLTQSSASTTYLTQSSASTQYEKLIPYSTSTPTSPVTGDMWLDSNSTPPALKVYDGSNWVQLGAAVDDSQAIIAGRMFA